MRIGIPTEVKDNEYRVALTPAGVHEFTGRGHEVFVQAGGGGRAPMTVAPHTGGAGKGLGNPAGARGKGGPLVH